MNKEGRQVIGGSNTRVDLERRQVKGNGEDTLKEEGQVFGGSNTRLDLE